MYFENRFQLLSFVKKKCDEKSLTEGDKYVVFSTETIVNLLNFLDFVASLSTFVDFDLSNFLGTTTNFKIFKKCQNCALTVNLIIKAEEEERRTDINFPMLANYFTKYMTYY